MKSWERNTKRPVQAMLCPKILPQPNRQQIYLHSRRNVWQRKRKLRKLRNVPCRRNSTDNRNKGRMRNLCVMSRNHICQKSRILKEHRLKGKSLSICRDTAQNGQILQNRNPHRHIILWIIRNVNLMTLKQIWNLRNMIFRLWIIVQNRIYKIIPCLIKNRIVKLYRKIIPWNIRNVNLFHQMTAGNLRNIKQYRMKWVRNLQILNR